jgi:uncharacterized protein YcfJ
MEGGRGGGTDTQMHTVTGGYVDEWVDGLGTDLLSLNELDKNEFEIMVRCSSIITGDQKVLCFYRKFLVDDRKFKQWNLW